MFNNVEHIEHGLETCLKEIIESNDIKKISAETWLGALEAYAGFDVILDAIADLPGLNTQGLNNIRTIQGYAQSGGNELIRIIKTNTIFSPKDYYEIRSEQSDLIRRISHQKGEENSELFDHTGKAYDFSEYIDVIERPLAYNAMIDNVVEMLGALLRLARDMYDSDAQFFMHAIDDPLDETVYLEVLNFMMWASSLDGDISEKEVMTIYDVLKSHDVTKEFIEEVVNDNVETFKKMDNQMPLAFMTILTVEEILLEANKKEKSQEKKGKGHEYEATRLYYEILRTLGGLIIASDKEIRDAEKERLNTFLNMIASEFKQTTGIDI